MKCSKCGKEIRNLPEYMQEMGAELLCSDCAGTAERSESTVHMFDYYRSRGSTAFTESSNDEMEVAA
jgi:ribosome-binding protein aMBF1 (putative translation factor)